MLQYIDTQARIFGKVSVAILVIVIHSGCTTINMPPLQASDQVIELERFMGDWYVVGSIPIDLPFASEVGAHNAIESYALMADGSIDTRYSFRKDAFDGTLKEFNPTGFVYDTETNTEWRMQFLWPFKSAYLIAWVAEDYSATIIGVPNRKYVWLMTREYQMEESEYAALVERARKMGHQTDKIVRIPHRW